jgi:hypothetical protein
VFPAHIIVAYLTADYAFANTNQIKTFDRKNLFKHWSWVILIFLAFTFDTLMTNVYGVIGLIALIVFHFYNDLLKKKSLILSELSGVASAILLNILFMNKLKNSYITPEFSFYLLGMLIATVVVSTIFRGVKIIDENSNDSDGIFERLAIYIFIYAGQYFWVFVSIIAALIYRLIVQKKANLYWILSPLIGIIAGFIWKILL